MKRFVNITSLLLALVLMMSAVSCTAPNGALMGGGYGGFATGDGMASGGEASSDSPSEKGEDGSEGGETTENPNNQNVRLPAGMITAGAWVDNDNYQLWIELFEQTSEDNGKDVIGKFNHFLNEKNSWGFNSLNRVKVSVKCEDKAVAGAKVIAKDKEGNVLFAAISDAQGNAYLFVSEEEGVVEVTSGEGAATAEFTLDSRELEVVLEQKDEKLNVIEIMFVVDVTGSMGDEISFLQAEIDDIIKRIASNDTNTEIKLAFLFYRDNGDSEKFAEYGFCDATDFSDMQAMLAILNKQNAKGGGDTPEAVDEALERAVGAQWSTGNTTKLIFHVLDAPAHSGAKYRERFNNAVNAAAEMGIRICPVICSGADQLTEYTMREAALHTGGTFIFVTDDSGIGNPHHDPELPNVTVELLNSMIVRLVNGYHTGTFEDPIYWKQDPNLAK